MVLSIPKAHHGLLLEQTGSGTSSQPIPIGSVEWFAWLEHHRSFRFESAHSTFTARKEKRPGGWYWYAYRRKQSKLNTAYIGKSEELTVERLDAVAATFERSSEKDTSTSLYGMPQLSQAYEDNIQQVYQATLVPLQTMFTGAMLLAEEALARHRELGDRPRIAEALEILGLLAFQQGRVAVARVYIEECLAIWEELNDQAKRASSLALLTRVTGLERDQAIIQGTSEKSLNPAKDEAYKQKELKITLAVHPTGLTRREYEVLQLLTKGFTNIQIARHLIVSLPTVNTHVRSIFSKLGVTSRTAATRYAFEHHLV